MRICFVIIVLLVLALATPGCTTTEQGAAIGGLGGAGIGAIVGNQLGSSWAGAAIGGVGGAVAGAIIGSQMD